MGRTVNWATLPLPKYTARDVAGVNYDCRRIKRAGYHCSEKSLLTAIKDNKSRSVVQAAAVCLQEYGSSLSLPALKALSDYPGNDVRICALTSIGVLAGEAETPYLADLLDEPGFKVKGYVMIVLSEVGDQRALPAVKRYAKKILQGKVSLNSEPPLQLFVMQYLRRFSDSEGDELYERLKLIPTEDWVQMSKEDMAELRSEMNQREM
jgi:hypothetical protein